MQIFTTSSRFKNIQYNLNSNSRAWEYTTNQISQSTFYINFTDHQSKHAIFQNNKNIKMYLKRMVGPNKLINIGQEGGV